MTQTHKADYDFPGKSIDPISTQILTAQLLLHRFLQ